jgi:protein-S-isoprenylcysteine O-methyltransferase Ste14
VLFAEDLILLSPPHAEWAAAVFVINAIYIPLLEEPMLEERFGDGYREYCRHVGRLLPRVRPWQGPRS